MNPAAKNKKPGTIALVVDERLTRERRGTLNRLVGLLKPFATVQLIDGEIGEEALVWKLQSAPVSLVLAPWYHYLKWSKVEAFFGLTRSSGATFAGYVCDPIDPSEIGAQADHLRAILLDFSDTQPHEAALLVQCLLEETKRTGIRPLIEPSATVYCENWFGGQGQGLRSDAILGLPEVGQTEWAQRAPAIRLTLGALWSLVYEEGSGKSELAQAKTPRAYFQVGCDSKTFAMRLWYKSPGSSAKGALSAFWPDPTRPTSASQLLLKHADFVRVHTLSDGNEIEVTAGLFRSAPAEKAHRRLHSLWIEPISPNLVSEVPFEAPGPDARHLKALPVGNDVGKPRGAAELEETLKSKERFIFEAAVKIRELKQQVTEKDELIRDLKSGGVGTSIPLPPPDAEALLEAFQERYFDARFQIRQFEIQIQEMEAKGATQQEIEGLRSRMAALAAREHAWIRKLASTVESFRAAKKGAG